MEILTTINKNEMQKMTILQVFRRLNLIFLYWHWAKIFLEKFQLYV